MKHHDPKKHLAKLYKTSNHWNFCWIESQTSNADNSDSVWPPNSSHKAPCWGQAARISESLTNWIEESKSLKHAAKDSSLLSSGSSRKRMIGEKPSALWWRTHARVVSNTFGHGYPLRRNVDEIAQRTASLPAWWRLGALGTQASTTSWPSALIFAELPPPCRSLSMIARSRKPALQAASPMVALASLTKSMISSKP